MKIDLSNILNNSAFIKWRWVFAIGIFIFIVAPFLGPQVNNFYDIVRQQDRQDKIEEESFIKIQYNKLEIKIEALNDKVVQLTTQIALLNYEKRRDRAAFISAPVAIWTVGWHEDTGDSWLEEFNPAFERLIFLPEGIDPDNALDKNWIELFKPAQAEAYNRDDLKVLKFGLPSTTNSLYTLKRDGTKQYWQVIKWPIRIDGKIMALKGIAVPINNL